MKRNLCRAVMAACVLWAGACGDTYVVQPQDDTAESTDTLGVEDASDAAPGDTSAAECTLSAGCEPGSICVNGRCEADPDFSPGGGVVDDPAVPDICEELGDGCGAAPGVKAWGVPVGEFCGVTAYSNANASATGCAYANARRDGVSSGLYGYEYQCVELTFRFLCTVYDAQLGCRATGKDGRAYGNAWMWWANTSHPVLSDDKIERLASGTTTERPRRGDVIVFNKTAGNAYGHVAVVRAVGDDYVELMEQNNRCTASDGARRMKLYEANGVYSVTNALGWLRVRGGQEACATPPPEPLEPLDGADTYSAGDTVTFSWIAGSESADHLLRVRNLDSGLLVLDGLNVGQQTSYAWRDVPAAHYRWVVYYESPNCADGKCWSVVRHFEVVANTCTPAHASLKCYNGDSYWYDACDVQRELNEVCPSGCAGGTCTGLSCVDSCDGCCVGETCYGGSDEAHCGSGGESCDACSGGESCTAQVCACAPKASRQCVGGDAYWFDSCGAQGDLADSCGQYEMCVDGVCEAQTCHIARTNPATSSAYTSCQGTAEHGLYKARSADPVGNYASITFTKCPDGGAPSVAVSYWAVTGVQSPGETTLCMPWFQPPQSCDELSCCRTSGTWGTTQAELTLNVRLWPSADDIHPSNVGEVKRIYLETGGGGPEASTTEPIWFSHRAVEFEIVCP